jgi:hypothetical protein
MWCWWWIEWASVTLNFLFIEGNQYTYKGNEFNAKTQSAGAVQDTVNNAIGNQEIGKSPIEYTNQLSRAKIVDMKGIRVAD